VKNELGCEHFKPTNKSGAREKCFCKFLNRNSAREAKMYKQFVKNLESNKNAKK
jgi:hypothetical protein